MQPRDYLRALRRGWPLILILVAVGALVGAAVAFVQRPVYVATAKAYVSVASATNAGDLVNSAQYTQQVAASFADIAGTSYVLRPVIASLKLDTTPAELADEVAVTAATDEAVLSIEATDQSAVRAASIANAIAKRLSSAVASLTPTQGRVDVTVVDPAVPPTSPISPVPTFDVGVGAAAGLLLGVVLAILRVLADTRLRTVQDVRAITTAPVLATTPLKGRSRRHAAAFGEDPDGPLAESYRGLRAALQFLDVDEGVRSIVVTSSVESEGKTVTAIDLAVALAETGERVLLVDADLRRPNVATLLGLDGSIGLSDVLIDRVGLEQAVQTDERGSLAALPSGGVPPNPNALLQSKVLERLLTELEDRYDRVVIDAPPVLSASDAAIIAHRASGALLLIGSGRVKRAQLQGALEVFRQTRAPVLGLVVTMLPPELMNAGAGAYRHAGGRSRRRGVVRPPVVPSATAELPPATCSERAVARAGRRNGGGCA